MSKRTVKVITYKKINAEALLLSVKHWERLRDDKERKGEGPYSESCPCCKIHRRVSFSCGDCPIAIRTGNNECRKTPFYKAKDAYERGHKNHESVQEEIDFLLGTRRLVLQGKIKP